MNSYVIADKFLGIRLKEAREAMGLHVTNLADLIGVSRPMVHEYESGSSFPGESTFTRICSVLNQPPRFFYHPHHETEFCHEMVHYRDLVANGLYSRAQAGVRLKWMMEYFSILERELNLPKPNFPNLDSPSDPALITQEYVEKAATTVRQLWNLGDAPITNLINILERNGAVVGQICLDLPDLDGLSFWSHKRQRPFILLNSDKASCVRSRFDAAHELGHMVLHRNITEGIDRKSPIYKRMEQQAHAFASAFLLPRTSWLKDVKKYTLATFKTLKPKWKTSIKAQIMRLANVGVIDDARKTSLLKQYSSKHWSVKEPYDDLWELEKPKLFSQATSMLAQHGFTASTISQVFPRRSENLSEIIGLPKTFFDTDGLPIQWEKETLN